MTNKDASIIIGNIPIEGDDCYTIAEYQEAKAMAIQALEQQPFINKPCVSEGICREDKIQVLDKIRAEIIELRSKQNVGVMECLDIIDKYKVESEDEE